MRAFVLGVCVVNLGQVRATLMIADYSKALPNLTTLASCPVTCVPAFTDPDVTMFSPHTSQQVPRNKLAVGVLLTESLGRYPFRHRTDAQLTYKRTSIVPFYGMMYDTAANLDRARHYQLPTWAEKKQRPLMSVWISARTSQRRERLLARMQVHGVTTSSYGRWLPTASLTAPVLNYPALLTWDLSDRLSGEQKLAHSACHLFLYAAENTNSEDYHTEKTFHGLMSGSVPVYLGSDTIDAFVPTHSIIKLSQFKNAAQAAAYIIAVANNETLYASYLAWRDRPLERHVKQKLEAGARFNTQAWRCDVCRALHYERDRV